MRSIYSRDAKTSSVRSTMYVSPASSNSVPAYFAYITVSPTETLTLLLSSSVPHPLPSATTFPRRGLSCAASGSRTPPEDSSELSSTYTNKCDKQPIRYVNDDDMKVVTFSTMRTTIKEIHVYTICASLMLCMLFAFSTRVLQLTVHVILMHLQEREAEVRLA